MKPDTELIEIWKRHNDSTRDYWKFMMLTSEERVRIFDLIMNNETKKEKEMSSMQEVVKNEVLCIQQNKAGRNL